MSELVEKTARNNGDLPKDDDDMFKNFVLQYWWTENNDGTKFKNWYHGPRLKWMKLYKERKKWKKK